MSLLSASKCVILLSDEGVTFYDAGSSRVVLLDTIPWFTEDFEETVAAFLGKRCRGKSVVVLNDMVEQHYRKERLPKASKLDEMSIIKRRVSAAFPSFPIRAALKMKEKAPRRDADAAPGDIYLFAAVPSSDNIQKILGALERANASLAGFTLLPVESSSMVGALSKKLLSKGAETPSTWTIFVGQHHGGGLRQVVTKNGELALTRMTSVSESDIDADQWSSDVISELRGTMSYLSRFGFDQNDGLDVIVIANSGVADHIADKIDFDCNLSVLTAPEAANLLKLKLGRQDDNRYADVLHVSWIANKRAPAMPLRSAVIDKIGVPAKIAMVACIALVIGCGYYGYTLYNNSVTWSESIKRLERENKNLESLRQEHAAEVEKKKAVGVDFMLIEKSTQFYESIDPGTMYPLPLLEKVAKALGPSLRLSSLDVAPVVLTPGQKDEDVKYDELGNPIPRTGPPPPNKFNVTLGFSFPPSLPVDQGVRQMQDLETRLREALPDHEVTVVKQVADLSYTGNFVGETTSAVAPPPTGGEKQNYEAQILIKGVLR
ncbi:MAG: hypothetical protein DI626_02665 [Micavibrio aeruginosavorus]|uniref:Uncharacterized protein n=1 Tax=Micavibrio aeruginosavorus TaxID=349221 RepID=A0A2W5A0G0_9BACT|nr:MAG: hypothetical protein DI626_02665 [Micavibrio aeruginosavorus]